jgi:hypothetical protein
MAEVYGRTPPTPKDEDRWGIVCFPGDCMSPVLVFSYPLEDDAAVAKRRDADSQPN